MSDIVEFLLARIAEDEAVARAATRGPWAAYAGSVDGYGKQPVVRAGFDSAGGLDDSASPENAAHIARHNPTRTLAECEAKRRIVDAETRFSTPDPAAPEHRWVGGDLELSNGSGGWVVLGGADRAEFVGRWYRQVRDTATLRILAQPYADHPDFDPAWRIE